MSVYLVASWILRHRILADWLAGRAASRSAAACSARLSIGVLCESSSPDRFRAFVRARSQMERSGAMAPMTLANQYT